jgi:hypothetical protein
MYHSYGDLVSSNPQSSIRRHSGRPHTSSASTPVSQLTPRLQTSSEIDIARSDGRLPDVTAGGHIAQVDGHVVYTSSPEAQGTSSLQSFSSRWCDPDPTEIPLETEVDTEPVIPVSIHRRTGSLPLNGSILQGLTNRLRQLRLGSKRQASGRRDDSAPPDRVLDDTSSGEEDGEYLTWDKLPPGDFPLEAIDVDPLPETFSEHGGTTLAHHVAESSWHDDSTLVHDPRPPQVWRPNLSTIPSQTAPSRHTHSKSTQAASSQQFSPSSTIPSLPGTDAFPNGPIQRAEDFLWSVWDLPWGWASEEAVSADYLPSESSRALGGSWQHPNGTDSWYARRQQLKARKYGMRSVFGSRKTPYISYPVPQYDYYDPYDETDPRKSPTIQNVHGVVDYASTSRLYGGAPSIEYVNRADRRSSSRSARINDNLSSPEFASPPSQSHSRRQLSECVYPTSLVATSSSFLLQLWCIQHKFSKPKRFYG